MIKKKYPLTTCSLLSILWLLVTASICLAADASFSWLPNTESNLAGYKIYYGQATRNYDNSIDVGLPAISDGRVHYTVTGLTAGTTYYFAATAYDTDDLESDFSTEVVWTAPSDTGGSNTVPVAQMSATPVTGTAPLEVNFNGSGSTDGDGDRLDYIWNFGDGSSATSFSSPLASHTYTVAGSYTATLKVDDGTDSSSEVTLTINVTPATSGGSGTSSPEAVINVDKATGTIPLTVTFNGSNSTPSDANGNIIQHAWNFGDGSTGTGAITQHTYTATGTYTAILTVTDNTNMQADSSATITATTTTENTSSHPTDIPEQKTSSLPNLLPIYKVLLLK